LSEFNKLISWSINTLLLFSHDLSDELSSLYMRFEVLTAKNLRLLNPSKRLQFVFQLLPYVYKKIFTTATPRPPIPILSLSSESGSFTSILSLTGCTVIL
jgi:hypothetical protein